MTDPFIIPTRNTYIDGQPPRRASTVGVKLEPRDEPYSPEEITKLAHEQWDEKLPEMKVEVIHRQHAGGVSCLVSWKNPYYKGEA
jgi:hypothetical protein